MPESLSRRSVYFDLIPQRHSARRCRVATLVDRTRVFPSGFGFVVSKKGFSTVFTTGQIILTRLLRSAINDVWRVGVRGGRIFLAFAKVRSAFCAAVMSISLSWRICRLVSVCEVSSSLHSFFSPSANSSRSSSDDPKSRFYWYRHIRVPIAWECDESLIVLVMLRNTIYPWTIISLRSFLILEVEVGDPEGSPNRFCLLEQPPWSDFEDL